VLRGGGLVQTRLLDKTRKQVYYLVMIKVNVYEAKKHLSRYLARVQRGERIVLCKRNVPIAELRPLPPVRREPRPIGLARGAFSVPASFFEPLPEALLEAFDGGAA